MPRQAWVAAGALVAVVLVLVALIRGPGQSDRANPVSAARIAQGWSDLTPVRLHITEYVMDSGEWPQDLAKLGMPLRGEVFNFSSPHAYELVATVNDDAQIPAELRGSQVTHRMDPQTWQWTCEAGENAVPRRYLPLNCRDVATRSTGEWRWMMAALTLALLLAAALGLLGLSRHPLVAPFQREPARLKYAPIAQLVSIDRALRWLRRRDVTVVAAGVDMSDWRDALNFTRSSAAQRAAQLALRVAARSAPSSGWSLPGDVFEWSFSADMPVSLERCLLWMPPADGDGVQLARHLRQVQTGLDVVLIVTPNAASEVALQRLAADTGNLFVVITQSVQSTWLLERHSLTLLLQTMAQQLRVTRISPYQTRGGVARASAFFGRTAQLNRIVQREAANYLLVGGRQLGKTSLIKAIERRLRDHPHLACCYVVLRDHRLLPRLAAQSGLPLDSSLDAVIDALAKQHAGKRLLLLIDEADPFFRHDAANGYVELAAMRALSEEGRCHFLLAGFWDLYTAAALDYQSPVRNFGEVISIGGLEADACRELASVPLSVLNLRFADSTLVDHIVAQCGQRANLVAIVCQECLETLEDNRRVIQVADVERALASQVVLDALAGWGRLTHDEAASRLDRIVVYHLAQRGDTRLADLVALLRPAASVDVAAVRRSLARLQLAYVVVKLADIYRFAVPLFARQFETAEMSVLLAEEMRQLVAAA